MRSFVSLFLVFLVAFSISAHAVTKVEDFTLTNYDGEKVTLSDLKNNKAILLIFVSTKCPVSLAYDERMVQLYNDYASKGVAFVALNSNTNESVDEVKKHAKENGFAFPVVKDVNNVVADKLKASVTPEVYLLSPDLDVVYHGRIDDSRRPEEVKSQDLRQALDLFLSGKEIVTKTTKAFGCTIKRVN